MTIVVHHIHMTMLPTPNHKTTTVDTLTKYMRFQAATTIHRQATLKSMKEPTDLTTMLDLNLTPTAMIIIDQATTMEVVVTRKFIIIITMVVQLTRIQHHNVKQQMEKNSLVYALF